MSSSGWSYCLVRERDELVGIRGGDEAVGHHQLQDVFESQARGRGLHASARVRLRRSSAGGRLKRGQGCRQPRPVAP